MPLPLVGMVIGATCVNAIALIVPANRLIVRLTLSRYAIAFLFIPFAGPSLFIYWVGLLSRSKRLADYKLDNRRFQTKPVEIINNQ